MFIRGVVIKLTRGEVVLNKKQVRAIADTVTNQQLFEMFNAAQKLIVDWTKVSRISANITKGTAWNMLAANFNVNQEYSISEKREMVLEFGEFLTNDIKYNADQNNPRHEEPKF